MELRPGRMPNPIVSEYAADPEMADLVELFISELPSRVGALETAWRERRIQNLARLAHQLKGSCAGYGFPVLGTAAGKLEDGLRGLAEPGAAASLEAVTSEFRRLIELCTRVCGQGTGAERNHR